MDPIPVGGTVCDQILLIPNTLVRTSYSFTGVDLMDHREPVYVFIERLRFG